MKSFFTLYNKYLPREYLCMQEFELLLNPNFKKDYEVLQKGVWHTKWQCQTWPIPNGQLGTSTYIWYTSIKFPLGLMNMNIIKIHVIRQVHVIIT